MLAVSFTLTTARDLAYLIAIAGFILALKGLSSPKHARQGNLVGAAAAVLAVGMTFTLPSLRHSGGTSCWRSSPWCSAPPSRCRWLASSR